MSYQHTTVENIKAMLRTKIAPFFQEGKLDVDIVEDHQDSLEETGNVHLVELPRPTYFDIMTNRSQEIKYLNSPELNFKQKLIGNTNWSTALKNSEYFINEDIDFKLVELDYYNINGYLNKGILNKTTFRYISTTQPIKVLHNEKNQSVASLTIKVALPKEICEQLKQQYKGKYSKDATLRVSVSGPALLCGMHSEGSFMKFHALSYFLEIYPESYTITVIENTQKTPTVANNQPNFTPQYSDVEGKIIRLCVKEGDAVKKNDIIAVAVVNNENYNILATIGGIVKNIKINEGDYLKKSDLMAVIAKK